MAASGKRTAEDGGRDKGGAERRREQRFPCVGIGLLYSPIQGGFMAGVGQAFYRAVSHDVSTSGVSFDVEQPVEPGQTLCILVANPGDGPSERLTAEVRWCREVDPGHYRVGTVLRAVDYVAGEERDALHAASIGQGVAVPADVRLLCPSCRERSLFRFVGDQPGKWGHGKFPLYDCSACGTTRSMASMLHPPEED